MNMTPRLSRAKRARGTWLFALATASTLACGSQVMAAEPGAADAAPARINVAHSAQLIIDAAETDDSLALRIRHASDHSLVNSTDVTVSVDGKNETVTRQSDGTYLVPAKDLRGTGERKIDIVVGHDGIRELLGSKVTLTKGSPTKSLLHDHKQLAWWILNVAIVLAGAIALSRRMS